MMLFLSTVISQHECDVIVLAQEITAWISVFCMKILKAGYLVIDR